MAQTYFGSTLRAGSGTLTDTTDGGYVVTSQTTTVTTASAGTATSATLTLPAYSQIIVITKLDGIVDSASDYCRKSDVHGRDIRVDHHSSG